MPVAGRSGARSGHVGLARSRGGRSTVVHWGGCAAAAESLSRWSIFPSISHILNGGCSIDAPSRAFRGAGNWWAGPRTGAALGRQPRRDGACAAPCRGSSPHFHVVLFGLRSVVRGSARPVLQVLSLLQGLLVQGCVAHCGALVRRRVHLGAPRRQHRLKVPAQRQVIHRFPQPAWEPQQYVMLRHQVKHIDQGQQGDDAQEELHTTGKHDASVRQFGERSTSEAASGACTPRNHGLATVARSGIAAQSEASSHLELSQAKRSSRAGRRDLAPMGLLPVDELGSPAQAEDGARGSPRQLRAAGARIGLGCVLLHCPRDIVLTARWGGQPADAPDSPSTRNDTGGLEGEPHFVAAAPAERAVKRPPSPRPASPRGGAGLAALRDLHR
eukprot:scaffold1202_cov384-Prasinococcus_capsulatus_cf.AAC.13